MAKKRALGADVVFLGAFESTYGTPPGTGYTRFAVRSTTLGAEQGLGTDPLIGQGRKAQDPFYEDVKVSGDLVVPVDLRAFGFFLKGIFGAPTTTGAGPYTHVFKAGGDLPSLAFEIGHPKLTTPKYFRQAGAKLGGFSIDLARTGAVGATIPVIAQGETAAGATIDAAPSDFALRRFMAGKGYIKADGTALGSVTGGKITFSNNLEPAEDIRDDDKIDGVDETDPTVGGSMTVRLTSATALDDAIAAQTPIGLEYGWSIPGAEGYLLKFEMARVFLPLKKGEVTGPKAIVRNYDWQGADDATAGTALTVTLVNDVESY